MTDSTLHTRWLLLSVAVNLFLAGYIVAGLMRPQDRPPLPPRPTMMLEEMSTDLTPEGQAVIKKIMAANGAKLERLQTAMITARGQARDVFAQDPFDPVAFRRTSEQGFVAAQAFFQALSEVLAQAGASLSAEDRAQLGPIGPPPPPR